MLLLLLSNVGLFIVDHIHFQVGINLENRNNPSKMFFSITAS